jgi:hypothetical protein
VGWAVVGSILAYPRYDLEAAADSES